MQAQYTTRRRQRRGRLPRLKVVALDPQTAPPLLCPDQRHQGRLWPIEDGTVLHCHLCPLAYYHVGGHWELAQLATAALVVSRGPREVRYATV